MHAWDRYFPRGMRLKSEGHSSSLYDPKGFTLDRYCKERDIPFQEVGLPIPVEVFVAYGREFQKQCVPALEPVDVAKIERDGSFFNVTLIDGNNFRAKQVVLATGIVPFAYVPETLEGLVGVSHSSRFGDLSAFAGKSVAIVGAGSSAIDLAVLLSEAGCHASLISRRKTVDFLDKPDPAPTTAWEKLRHPTSCMPGIKGLLYEKFPGGFRMLPDDKRERIIKEFVGPAGGWFVREQFYKNVTLLGGFTISNASDEEGQVCLELTDASGSKRQAAFDHVIAGTGFRIEVQKLTYLSSELIKNVVTKKGAPVLSANLETSVPGLFIIGPAATPTFGPVMRFACGAKFTSERLVRRLSA